jgi:hypothetical protein
MKKTTSLMLALLFSGAMLLGEAINTTARASEEGEIEDGGLKCKQLTGCKGDSGCGGQGEGENCILDCADGAHIHCAQAQE